MLEVRNLLAADVESVWAPLQSVSGSDVVGAIKIINVDAIVGAGARSRAPSTPSKQVVVEPPTTEVKLPESEIPEGTFERVERRSPPINIIAEQVIRMPEKSGIPEGTIQLVDRPRPPVNVIAVATGPAFLECPTDLIAPVRSQTRFEGAQAAAAVVIEQEPAPISSGEPVVELPSPPSVASTAAEGITVTPSVVEVRSIRPNRRVSEFDALPTSPAVLVAGDAKPSDNCSEQLGAPQPAVGRLVTQAGNGQQARDIVYSELVCTLVGTKVRGRNKG